MLLKTFSKNSCSFKNSVSLFNVEAVFVHELPPLFSKTFSTTLHNSMMKQMIQMILAFVNTFQILNINLLMNLNFKLEIISYFKKFKN